MKDKKFTSAVILAGGSGTRVGADITKQKIKIGERSVLAHSVNAFEKSEKINEIIVVCRADELDFAKSELTRYKKVKRIVAGGKTRRESAMCGFLAVSDAADYVAVHDAARCMISTELIDKVAEAACLHGAASAVSLVTDTVKTVDSSGMITGTVPRENLRAAQTPQIFKKEIYKRALKETENKQITDDNMMAELIGVPVYAVENDEGNFKITTKKDVEYAEFLMGARGYMNDFKIGHGYDVHKLVPNRKLIIGGVEIPHSLGLLGHSDADVLIHAVMDAILGALGLGDIGRHFPDTDEEFSGISSMKLLTKVGKMMSEKRYGVSNIDATLIMQKPKVAPYIDEMRKNIAFGLGISPECVNVKATTEEGLGFTGREDGASAHCVVLLTKER